MEKYSRSIETKSKSSDKYFGNTVTDVVLQFREILLMLHLPQVSFRVVQCDNQTEYNRMFEKLIAGHQTCMKLIRSDIPGISSLPSAYSLGFSFGEFHNARCDIC